MSTYGAQMNPEVDLFVPNFSPYTSCEGSISPFQNEIPNQPKIFKIPKNPKIDKNYQNTSKFWKYPMKKDYSVQHPNDSYDPIISY